MLKDMFRQNLIFINEELNDKKEVIKFISNKLAENDYASNSEILYNEFNQREEEISTGIGNKIAIPHIRNELMKENVIVFIKNKGIDWNSLDNLEVEYIFAIAITKKDEENNLHLLTLQKLANLFSNLDFKNNLAKINSSEEFLDLVSLYEDKLNKEAIEIKEKNYKKKEDEYILAITSCPTGIAHTYLAAQKLKKAGKKLGINLKVETQGANGIENKISSEEIQKAKGLILAIDRNIETIRFKNLDNIIETSTSKAIKNSEELIKEILAKKGTKLQNITGKINENNNTDDNEEFTLKNFGKKSYKALLTGISYMLPFVVFGGIMIAIGFLIDSFAGAPAGNDFGKTHVVAHWFNSLGGISFSVFIAILAAYISFAIVGRVGLLPGFVVGFISTGAFNPVYVRIFNIPLFASSSSGFFGAIVGSFFSAFMIIIFMKYVLHKFPKSLNGIKQIIIVPFFGTLIIASLFVIINIPLLYLNFGFSQFLNLFTGRIELAWLLGLIAGIMMGVDLGGPINKAAYVFAVSTLSIATQGQSQVMAAVMAAGMVPPIMLALSTLINHKIWSKEERIESQANWIFGFSFISEGAIPLTAKYPKRLVLANLISAGLTGMISSLLGVTIAAPHGGIFVAPLLRTTLISNLNLGLIIFIAFIFWMLAIFIGALAGVLVIWLMHKYNKNQPTKERKYCLIKYAKSKLRSSKKQEKFNVQKIRWQDVKIHKLNEVFKKI